MATKLEGGGGGKALMAGTLKKAVFAASLSGSALTNKGLKLFFSVLNVF